MMAMTDKQQAFVREYLIDLNATQAAIRAGYSEKTARAIGHENLSKPEIAAAIEVATEERAEKVALSQEWVLERLMNEALNDARSSARVQALKLLGEHLGMFVKRSQVEITGVFDRIAAMEEDELRELLDLKDDEIHTRLAGLTGHVGHA